MLPPMSVPGVIVIVTGLFLGRVVSSPVVQEECNDLKPVVCPNYGMCCTADQFCSANSGTCESCFPEAITKRDDRLKFCSDLEKKRTNSSMRHYTCKAACITLFNMTEIMSYVDKAPEKTAKELITDHNSSMHEHLEGSVVNRIDDNQRRVASLEDEVYSLRVAVIISVVLAFIAIIIQWAIYRFWRCRGSKKEKQTDRRETEQLLVDDKKLSDAFDLNNNTSLFSKTWSPFEKIFNQTIHKITTRVGKLEKKVQDTEGIFTKNFDELKPEVARLNVSQQQLESGINEIKKLLDDNRENSESLFSKTWLPSLEEIKTDLKKTTSRVEEQEKRLQDTYEKLTNINVDMENANVNSQQPSHSGLDALKEFLDKSLDKKMDPINVKLTFLMKTISNQENIALARDQKINKASQSTLAKAANPKRAYSPIEGVTNVLVREGDEDVELSKAD